MGADSSAENYGPGGKIYRTLPKNGEKSEKWRRRPSAPKTREPDPAIPIVWGHGAADDVEEDGGVR